MNFIFSDIYGAVACKVKKPRRGSCIAPRTSEILNSLLIHVFTVSTFVSLYRIVKNYHDDHIYKQIENLPIVCVETAERHR